MPKFHPVNIVLLLLVLVSPAGAAQVLDQANTPATIGLSSNVIGVVMQAQVFEVGITGTLTRLDVIGVATGVGSNLKLDIRKASLLLDTAVGHPPSNNPADILETQTVTTLPPVSPFPGPTGFTSFSFNIPVVAGDLLAFVFHLDGNPGSAGFFGGPSTPDGYVPGNLWSSGNPSINGGNWYPNGNSDLLFDLAFRTWVTEIPEPSALGLMGVLALGALQRGRAARIARR